MNTKEKKQDEGTVPEGFEYFGNGPVIGFVDEEKNADIAIFNEWSNEWDNYAIGKAKIFLYALRKGSKIHKLNFPKKTKKGDPPIDWTKPIVQICGRKAEVVGMVKHSEVYDYLVEVEMESGKWSVSFYSDKGKLSLGEKNFPSAQNLKNIPETKRVPLDFGDFPAGSFIRGMGRPPGSFPIGIPSSYQQIVTADPSGISLVCTADVYSKTTQELADDEFHISTDKGVTWNPCWKEVECDSNF